MVFVIPTSLQLHAANPLNAGAGHTGLGLDISILARNAAAGALVLPYVTQTTSGVILAFHAPVTSGLYQIKIDARFSDAR